MKTIEFLIFACATVFGGIGIENTNFLAMIAGMVFMALSVLLIMKHCQNEIEKSK